MRTEGRPKVILVAGAAGTIGFPVVKSLCARRASIRALVRSEKSSERLKALGVAEVFLGDLRSRDDLVRALKGCRSFFHIMPPFSEDEFEVGRQAVEVAREAGIEHLVFNSVLHPQMSDMPHHAKKLRVEEQLVKSGLDFNVIQPAMLMQNLLGSWPRVRDDAVFSALSAPDRKFALVDAEDVGEAIANVLTDRSLRNATFELAGPDTLTYEEMAAVIGGELETPLEVSVLDAGTRRSFAESQGWAAYAIETFLKMLEHYDAHGFPGGNKLVLAAILKREPQSYRGFIRSLVGGTSCGPR